MSFVDDWNNESLAQAAQGGRAQSWDDYFKAQEQDRILKELQSKNAKAAQPKGNFLSSLLPTGGGIGGALGGAAAGAALGSVVPIVGTGIGGLLGAILGGAGGSAAGKVGQNAIEGEADLGKGVAGEALLGGLTSTPLTAGLKLAKAGVKVATGIGKTSALQSVQEAGRLAIPKLAGGLQAKATNEIAQTAGNTAPQAANGLLGRLQGAATNADATTSGFGVGKTLNGSTITPSRSTELLDFARTNGVNAGTPLSQATAAQGLLNRTTGELDSTLNSINRLVGKDEIAAITANAGAKVAEDATITGATKTLDKFATKIANAKDIKSLEAIRKEADNIAFTQKGAGKTSAAAQARSVRESIDEAITALSPEYKATKGAYVNSRDVLELASKNAGSSKGGLNLLGNNIGSQVIPGAISKATNLASSAGSRLMPSAGSATGQGVFGAGVRESLLGARPELSQQAAPELDASGLTAEDYAQLQTNPLFAGSGLGGDTTDSMAGGATAPSNPFGISLQDVAGQLQVAIQKGDTKGYATLSDLYDKINDYETSAAKTTKPLSAEGSKTAAITQAGLASLGQLEGISSGSGVPLGTIVGGRNLLGGLGANLLGTSSYDAAADNVADAMVRLRTGAAATKEELQLYKQLLPQAFDSEEVKAQKIQAVRDYFAGVGGGITSGTQGTDAQQAFLNYQ